LEECKITEKNIFNDKEITINENLEKNWYMIIKDNNFLLLL
jgi:hypothetical protein